jgi:hypothetical protein
VACRSRAQRGIRSPRPARRTRRQPVGLLAPRPRVGSGRVVGSARSHAQGITPLGQSFRVLGESLLTDSIKATRIGTSVPLAIYDPSW